MANLDDVRAKLNDVETSQQGLIDALTTYITEVTNAVNRLLAKIAAGSIPDLQPEVDRLQALVQKNADSTTSVNSATDSVKVEGL